MIKLENVSKEFPNGYKAVRDLSLEVEEGETLILLGTSGSGKTTTMKMVNHLIYPTEGTITIDGEDINKKDPYELRRNIGYAIQHIGLFPHMTVAENIAVVPELLNWSTSDIEERTDMLLNMVGLEPEDYRDRYPNQLSGGQKQRVGVARSLAADPPIVLMDEPFGALDPITREQLQNEFLELESVMKKTIIFVTHDIFEAVKMGDRVALLDEGKLMQVDKPLDLVENPANEFVDQFLGQHRFQLSLLTRTVESVMEYAEEQQDEQQEKEQKPEDYIGSHSSLVAALDYFKSKNKDQLPVYKQKTYLGMLKKKELIDAITDILQAKAENNHS